MSSRDTVAFALVGAPPAEVEIRVNGLLLQELVGPVELPWASGEGKPHLAGDYQGLGPWTIREATHFLGAPRAVWFDDGDTVLLGCGCGEWGCWPLTVDVEVRDDVVRWSNFRQGHRDWDLSPLGPFVFDRAAYDAALADLATALVPLDLG